MGPITPDSGWQTFTWTGGPGTPITENPFTFTLTKWGTLTVTDAYVIGDQFQVSDGATVLGTTTVPVVSGPTTSNPDVALASSTYSHGQFSLAPGPHSINLVIAATCCASGGAFLRVDSTALPIPATSYWGLGILAALLAVGGVVVALRMRAH